MIFFLSLHILFFCVHFVLVSKDIINPWKLGGYGMYTIPAPTTFVNIAVVPVGLDLSSIADEEYEEFLDGDPFVAKQNNFVAPCFGWDVSDIAGIFEENPDYHGRDLRLVAVKRAFTRYPISVFNVVFADIEVRWLDSEIFDVSGQVCEREFLGIGTLTG